MRIRSLSSSLFLLAVVSFSGCAGLDGHRSGAVESAISVEQRYVGLDSALAAGVARLENLAREPGTVEVFLKNLAEAESATAGASSELQSARADLLEHGREHARLLKEEAVKFADGALGKRFAADADKLAQAYAKYEAQTADLAKALDLARSYLRDIHRALELDRSANGVSLVQDTLRKTTDEWRRARAKIPAARDALAELRRVQPQPPAPTV